MQQAQITKTPYADGFWQFNQYIVDPKAQDSYPHLIRDIKLSYLDSKEKVMCLEILRRIARLKSIGDFQVPISPKKQSVEITTEEAKTIEPDKINTTEDGKIYVTALVPQLDEYGEPLMEIKNKFPRSLQIYINDLFSLVNVASATNGFERNALTTQITKGSQHLIEETRNKQERQWMGIFGGKKKQ